MRWSVALGLAVAALSTASHATTLVVNSGPLSSSVSVQQFDPSLGTLTSISGTLTGQATYQFTFNNPIAANVDYTVSNFFGLYFGPTFFDGTLTATGQVFVPSNTVQIVTSGSATDVRSSAAALAYFTGTGSVMSSPSVDPPFQATFSPNGGGIQNVMSTSRLGSIEITYTYTPFNGAVPEPGTWMLLVAGFGAIGVMTRRRRLPIVARS